MDRSGLRPRIVIVNDRSTVLGGASALAVQLGLGLAARGHRVSFLSGDKGENEALSRAGVEIEGLGSADLLNRGRFRAMLSGLYNSAARDFLRDWISRNDTPDTIYHLHNWSHILSPSVFSALKAVAGRTILTAHDFFLACPNGAFANYPAKSVCRLRPLSMACLASACDKRSYPDKLWRVGRHLMKEANDFGEAFKVPVTVIHEKMAEFFLRSGFSPDRLTVIRNPAQAYTPTRIRSENNREVVYIGRLVAEKGPEVALEAARLAGRPARVIGAGPLEAELRLRYPDAEFEGWTARDQIGQRMAAARLVVLPSRYPEPFGLVAIESVLSGVPVLAGHSAFIADELDQIGAGISVGRGTATDFAAAIRSLDDDMVVQRMSCAGVESVGKLALSPDAWIDAMENVYSRRLGGLSVNP